MATAPTDARPFRGLVKLRLLALVAGLLGSNPGVEAGVSPGRQLADSTVVYVGIVPAAITRSHATSHVERAMHGGSSNDIHEIHVMVALFDRPTGTRITNAKVDARFTGRGRTWFVQLQPMTINGALTYGGYTSMGADMKATIFVHVLRPSQLRKPHAVTARFEYEHD